MSSAETPWAGKIGIITSRAPILRKGQLGLLLKGARECNAQPLWDSILPQTRRYIVCRAVCFAMLLAKGVAIHVVASRASHSAATIAPLGTCLEAPLARLVIFPQGCVAFALTSNESVFPLWEAGKVYAGTDNI
jgi:hypothetical protein